MSLEAAFLSDIITNPDDDTPRLVYADWLDDHGDSARAEFIRVQCRLARMAEAHSHYAPLHRRARELLHAHRQRFLGPLAHLLVGGSSNLDEVMGFQRGFVESMVVPLEAFMRHAEEVWARTTVQSLGVYGAAPLEALAALMNCPHMARIRSLNLGTLRLPGGGVKLLARSPYLARVTELSLMGTEVSAEDLVILAGSPLFEGLTSLDLAANFNIGVAGAAVLANCPQLTHLTNLNLLRAGVGNAGAVALAGSPYLRNLTTLTLFDNEIGAEGVRALADSPVVARLSHLDLSQRNPCPDCIGPQGARALATSSRLSHLVQLRLHGGAVGVTGAVALASSRSLQSLALLGLTGNDLGPEGAIALATASRLSRLVHLELDRNGIGDEGVVALASSLLHQLRWLSLRHNEVGSAAVEALARSPGVANVKFLGLAYNPIGDRGAQALIESPYLNRLETLDLQGCNLSPRLTLGLLGRFGSRVWLSQPA
jgi:uncharacterized protein (TIGR02996 family)